MNTETFKDIIGYEGLYQISNYGNVRNAKTNKILKSGLSSTGYYTVSLKGLSHSIHRLLAIHFIPNPNNKGDVNHINGIKTDNNLKNLEWVTRSENTLHGYWILGNHLKSVTQMDLEGNVLNIYRSIKEASELTKCLSSRIVDVCKGNRKTSGGFKWAYTT